MTTCFYIQVTKEIANRSYTGPAGLNPRMLRLKWSGDGEPQQWDEKIILTGSEDLNFLLLTQPTAPIVLLCRYMDIYFVKWYLC